MKIKDIAKRIISVLCILALCLPGVICAHAADALSGWVWPVPGSYVINSLDCYTDGSRHNEGQCFDIGHNGYNGAQRLDIVSCTAGTVATVVNGYADRPANDGSWGNYVLVQYSGYNIVYAHLSRVDVTKGQSVQPGTVLGKMGTSGQSTGVHLHLQVWPIGARSSSTAVKAFDCFWKNAEYQPNFRFARGLEQHSERYGAWLRTYYTKLSGNYYTYSGGNIPIDPPKPPDPPTPPEPVPDTGVTLQEKELSLLVGQSAALHAAVVPTDATDRSLRFTSLDPSVASVDASGKVSALRAGSTVIEVRSASDHVARCTVKVRECLVYNGNTITDVTTEQWFYESAAYALNHGIFQGMSPTSFAPDEQMTRGMLATVIGRMAGAQVEGYEYSRFLDLDMTRYYGGYVVWADEQGIMNGIGGDFFDPDSPVTREQLCTVIVRYLLSSAKKIPERYPEQSFTDAQKISEYARPYVTIAQRAGYMNGRDDGAFSPQDCATRAEVAAVLMRVLTVA